MTTVERYVTHLQNTTVESPTLADALRAAATIVESLEIENPAHSGGGVWEIQVGTVDRPHEHGEYQWQVGVYHKARLTPESEDVEE